MELKLNLGSGWRNFGEGWDHIDGGNYVHLKYHNLTKLDYSDNSVDLIYASHVFEYFDREEGKKVLREWFRVLKPEGVLRISVPDFEIMSKLYNEGKFFRDLIYISDVVEGIYKILTKGSFGELYWISSNKKTWFYQLGKLLEKHTNGKIKYVKLPNYTKKVDVGNFIVNNTKLKNLGWTQKVSLENGIKQTLNSFK